MWPEKSMKFLTSSWQASCCLGPAPDPDPPPGFPSWWLEAAVEESSSSPGVASAAAAAGSRDADNESCVSTASSVLLTDMCRDELRLRRANL